MNNVHWANVPEGPHSAVTSACRPGPPRQQEIAAAAHRHEPREAAEKQRRRTLDHHPASISVNRSPGAERIAIVAETEHVAIPQPLLLNELELALDRRLVGDEHQAALVPVGLSDPLGQLRPITNAPAQHPVALGRAPLPAECVAGV